MQHTFIHTHKAIYNLQKTYIQLIKYLLYEFDLLHLLKSFLRHAMKYYFISHSIYASHVP